MSEALRAIRQIIEMPGTEIGPRSPAGSLPLTPYPGLRPFEQDEWPIFLGRERITRDIVDRLTGRPRSSSFMAARAAANRRSFAPAFLLNWIASAPGKDGNGKPRR